MKIVFFGLGSIGQRHAKILLDDYHHQLYAFRSGASSARNDLGIRELNSWDEVEKLKPDIAFITNPTSLHIETATKCAKLGCRLFIEKPIDKDIKGLEKLVELVKKNHLVTYVAYCMRFHPVIEQLKKYINKRRILHIRAVCTSFYPLWRPGRDYLKTYSANSGMGGGVILDLSHEIDYISYLAGPVDKISGNFSKRGKVTVDAEDWADIHVSTKLGPANIHINFFSQLHQRYIQIDFEDLTIIGDVFNAEIREYKKETLHKSLGLDYDKGQEYREQIKYFFDNINNPKMMNNLEEAADLFKKIIAFKNG